MAKGVYVGVSSKARKVKSIYVGVSNKARKVKKVYVGVNGIARLSYSGNAELKYKKRSTLTLTDAASKLTGTGLSSYGFFAGGTNLKAGDSSYISNVHKFNSSLSWSVLTPLQKGRFVLSSTSTSSYAIFAGGHEFDTSYMRMAKSNKVDAYNTAGSRTICTNLSYGLGEMKATTIGDTALFGGGYDTSYDQSYVYAYNNSLTNVNVTSLYAKTRYGRNGIGAASNNNYAIFITGYSSSSTASAKKVNAYNSSLTRNISLTMPDTYIYAAAKINNKVLLCASYSSNPMYRGTNTIYIDDNLSMTTLSSNGNFYDRYEQTGISVNYQGNAYALFVGGALYNYGSSTTYPATNGVEVYNSDLSKSYNSIQDARLFHAAFSFDKYAVVFGGVKSYNSSSNSDVYYSMEVFEVS